MTGADDGWFHRAVAGDGITRFTEPHVHAYFSANFWHVRGRDADLLVDTGMGLAPLAPEIDTGGRPLIALATHIHLDHVGGMHEFADRAGPAISADAFAAMDEALTFAAAFREIENPVDRLPHQGWTSKRYRLKPAPLNRLLAEGDVIDLGDRRFRVLELPGHSTDSIGLIDETNGIFFSGDAIYDDTLIDDIAGSHRTTYRETIRRLKTLDFRIGHGGHGPSFSRARLIEIADAYLANTSAH